MVYISAMPGACVCIWCIQLLLYVAHNDTCTHYYNSKHWTLTYICRLWNINFESSEASECATHTTYHGTHRVLLQQLFGYWTNGPLPILILNTWETDKVKGAIRLIYTCPDLASHDRARDYRSPKLVPPDHLWKHLLQQVVPREHASMASIDGLPDHLWRRRWSPLATNSPFLPQIVPP